MRADLAIVAVGRVQQFIGEARTTADVSGASAVLQKLVRDAAARLADRLRTAPEPYGLVFPCTDTAGADVPVSNKLVFLAPAGQGADLAAGAADVLRHSWHDLVSDTFGRDRPSTPGFPEVSWCCVTGSADDYAELWASVQQEMAGRRRSRVFAPYEWTQLSLCSQSPGLPAQRAPRTARKLDADEKLSAAGWVKRRQGERAPSTVSIASAAFRMDLARAAARDSRSAERLVAIVARLARVVERAGLVRDRWTVGTPHPGAEMLASVLGAWVHQGRWDDESVRREHPDAAPALLAEGRAAVADLVRLAGELNVAPPSPYLAVLTQDLDRLGQAFSRMSLADQRAASMQLSDLARRQRELVATEHPTAHLVYTGGDDLLAFAPAATALPLAAALRAQAREACSAGPLAQAGPDGDPLTASTGVLFAHMSSPLTAAVDGARAAISRAKGVADRAGRSRDALCVVVRRRGGERATTVQPWWPLGTEVAATDLLALARPGRVGGTLSAGLASLLERDAAELDSLTVDRSLLRAEIRRLVLRQGGSTEAAAALVTLGLSERTDSSSATFRPVPAALVARFLAQEAS